MQRTILDEQYNYSLKNKKITASTLIIVTVLLLQVFRRLSSALYVMILLMSYIFWIANLPGKRTVIKSKPATLLFLTWFILIPIGSLINLNIKDYGTAIVRYGAILPFVIFSFSCPETIRDNRKEILKIYSVVIATSGFLMIYQVFFGRISFFVETTGRLGYERYGSLLGSTTTYGSSAMVGIMILHTFKPFKRWICRTLEILILIGGILCLSKAFFINFAMGNVLIFLFEKRERKITINQIVRYVLGILGIAFVVFILYMLLRNTIIGNYFSDMYKYTFHNENLGANTDLLARISTLPRIAFDYYNKPWYYYLLFGQGLKGYSGVLGLPDYPMCHNNYFEAILVGGVTYLLAILSIYLGAFRKALSRNDETSIFTKTFIPYVLVNMFAGGGSIIATTGLILFVFVVSYYVLED